MSYNLQTIRDYFENRAAEFATSSAANAYRLSDDGTFDTSGYLHLAQAILRLSKSDPGQSLVDIGCGTGALAAALQPSFRKLVAVDISLAMVRRACAAGVDAVHYDGDVLPFSDGVFDRALIFSVLINLPTAEVATKLVKEALRVTRPGGTVIVGNLPIPGQSPFPTHEQGQLNWKGRAARALAFSRDPEIKYFSYPFSFFESFTAGGFSDNVSFSLADKSMFGATPKYHAVLRRG